MPLKDDVDATIRDCEIAGIRCAIATSQRLSPQTGAACAEIAGGLIAFAGADSPLSQAYGIVGPVTDADVAAIASFYEGRGATARVFVTPLSDSSLGRALAASGFAPCEYENVLASDSFDPHAAYDDHIGVAPDLDVWAAASAQAFTGRASLTPADMAIARVIAYSDGVCATEARVDGTLVGTAAMDVRLGCAALFAGSTLEPFRGHGWHVAMIRDRIARARDAGARLMRATARPRSISERNFIRCGFSVLYTRALWERRP
ncbi:MAG: hypothetical protein JO146_08700 [Candidatus Eremiobacteraeota bacterium]|nr:hypothetical protein [Candidatus Eremiobacteraeota bacterium]